MHMLATIYTPVIVLAAAAALPAQSSSSTRSRPAVPRSVSTQASLVARPAVGAGSKSPSSTSWLSTLQQSPDARLLGATDRLKWPYPDSAAVASKLVYGDRTKPPMSSLARAPVARTIKSPNPGSLSNSELVFPVSGKGLREDSPQTVPASGGRPKLPPSSLRLKSDERPASSKTISPALTPLRDVDRSRLASQAWMKPSRASESVPPAPWPAYTKTPSSTNLMPSSTLGSDRAVKARRPTTLPMKAQVTTPMPTTPHIPAVSNDKLKQQASMDYRPPVLPLTAPSQTASLASVPPPPATAPLATPAAISTQRFDPDIASQARRLMQRLQSEASSPAASTTPASTYALVALQDRLSKSRPQTRAPSVGSSQTSSRIAAQGKAARDALQKARSGGKSRGGGSGSGSSGSGSKSGSGGGSSGAGAAGGSSGGGSSGGGGGSKGGGKGGGGSGGAAPDGGSGGGDPAGGGEQGGSPDGDSQADPAAGADQTDPAAANDQTSPATGDPQESPSQEAPAAEAADSTPSVATQDTPAAADPQAAEQQEQAQGTATSVYPQDVQSSNRSSAADGSPVEGALADATAPPSSPTPTDRPSLSALRQRLMKVIAERRAKLARAQSEQPGSPTARSMSALTETLNATATVTTPSPASASQRISLNGDPPRQKSVDSAADGTDGRT